MQLEDTTAFVTGPSCGIGRAIAVELADRGAEVALAARSDGIYETEEEIDAPERTLAVETDVGDGASVEASIEEAVEEFGGVDVNAVCPGPVQGERMSRAMTKLMEIAEEDDVRSTDLAPDDLALQQMMVEQEDVADAVAWFAEPDARHVTAQDFNVDNGLAWY